MARQGCPLHESEIQRIVRLLASTDMTLLNIAERTGRSHAAIAAINRRYQVREYGGRRSTWKLSPASPAAPAADRRLEWRV
jgi:hypothetical protein